MLDCHLMVSQLQFEQGKAAGVGSVTFHVEAEGEPAKTIARARELGVRVGVALNPETPVARAGSAAGGADFVLWMSIGPGLAGQELCLGLWNESLSAACCRSPFPCKSAAARAAR